MQRKIAVLFGGESPEHEVSINSGINVAGGLERSGVSVAPIYIGRDGLWHWPEELGRFSAEKRARGVRSGDLIPYFEPRGMGFARALARLEEDGYDTTFIVLHGENGEDGRLQGALEMSKLRYTGSRCAACSLAMDKPRCQAYLTSLQLPVPKFVTILRDRFTDAEVNVLVMQEFGLPCVVKPALGGSSVGVTVVRSAEGLREALRLAGVFGNVIHIEAFVRGREFTCGVLEGDERTALPVTEIIPPEGRIFDYDAKYTPGVTREVTPAEIPDVLSRRIQKLAVEVHRVVGCEGYSRVDFMCDEEGPKIIEVNTAPGMTDTSLLPQGAKAAGIDFTRLVQMIVEHSMKRLV
jgi:D-alanine-D-alanine ligase